MYGHQYKKWGVVVSVIGFITMMITRFGKVLFLKKYSLDQQYAVFEWIMLFGLILVMFCKEEFEDERAKAIRLKALQTAFIIEQAVLLAMALVTGTYKSAGPIDASLLFAVSALGIIMYLLIFHVGLYFDFLWDFEDRGLLENWRNLNKNKWGMLVYLVLAAIAFLIITFI